MNVLALNPGSSTLKLGLFAVDESLAGGAARDALRVIASGAVAPIGAAGAELRLTRSGASPCVETVQARTAVEAAERAIARLEQDGLAIDGIGCRVVHGGPSLVAPAVVSPELIECLRTLEPLAPLHNPIDVAILELLRRRLPGVPTVAVFDTAFHRTLPAVASTYALPVDLAERQGVRRYGFHGISHAYVAARLLARLERGAAGTRMVTCHLGSGASVCALRDGESVDVSMGMTPMEGLVMATRSGDLDPGVMLYLLRHAGLSAGELDHLLNHESGLTGLSGVGGDLRAIEVAAARGDGRAELALAIFAYRVTKYVGAYAAALGGLDALAFSGGIGEHSPSMRARICASLGVLGLALDADRNQAATGEGEAWVAAGDSRVAVWVIPTDEEREIAAAVVERLVAA